MRSYLYLPRVTRRDPGGPSELAEEAVSGCPFLSVYVIASVINTLVMSLHKIIICEYYWFCNLCYIRGCLGCTYWGRLLPAPYT